MKILCTTYLQETANHGTLEGVPKPIKSIIQAEEMSIEQQITELHSLLTSLNRAETLLDRLTILNALSIVKDYLQHPSPIRTFLAETTLEGDYAIKSIITIGQAPIVFNGQQTDQKGFERLRQLLGHLLNLERFYQHLGGIIGYHLTVLSLIAKQEKHEISFPNHIRYIRPKGLYLGQDHPEVRQAIRWGIENIKNLAEMYPIGGAGDRLNLIDEKTNTPLPAARLPFLGRTLLEGLIRDLQAREYLFFKLFGEQPLTPIAMMTSIEKDNHNHILEICRTARWFGRPIQSFYFFIQPLVPVITSEGHWSLSAPLKLTLKPCGHGVLWKLAEEQGAFAWMESQERYQCLVRQINNPLAGTDSSLLALSGIGVHHHKAFGFVSCERLLNSDEGTNVLIETQNDVGYEYRLTNIEYTDFTKRGIGEIPAYLGSPFSIYPTNTNILFANISSIRAALRICPIPGQLINMKSKVSYIDPEGHQSYIPGGRLESTMQNIADYLVDYFPCHLNEEESQHALKTFIVYNTRSKTISTTKRSYQPGESPLSTPEQAFYDLISNYYTLLQLCHFEMPPWREIKEHLLQGPACLVLLHPALGPLNSIITQKIRGGGLAPGAELQLEIAELDIEDLQLEGSLLIEALSPLGTFNALDLLEYGNESRCTLRHVKIRNQGIDRQATRHYWKNEIIRKEMVKIVLHEGAEFHAEDIVFVGSYHFEVPPYHRLVLQPSSNHSWIEKLYPLQKPTWYWRYTFDSQQAIILEKIHPTTASDVSDSVQQMGNLHN